MQNKYLDLILFAAERNFYRRMSHRIALEILASEFYRANGRLRVHVCVLYKFIDNYYYFYYKLKFSMCALLRKIIIPSFQ